MNSRLIPLEEREVQVCNYCNHEVTACGEDGISYCFEGGCGCVEGETRTITEAEYEEIHT